MAPPEREPDKRLARLRAYSVKNMIYSMALVLALALAWWALMPNSSTLQRQPVDPAPVAGYVADQVPFEVWSPQGLPDGWTVTYAQDDPVEELKTWAVGALTPAGTVSALNQVADPSQAWLDHVLRGTTPDGEAQIDGPHGVATWQRHTGPDVTVLVLEGDGVTTVVRGGASTADLETFIGHLQPVTR